MERYDCKCHNRACNNVEFGCHRVNELDINGEIKYTEVQPGTIEQCATRDGYIEKIGEFTIKLAGYKERFGVK